MDKQEDNIKAAFSKLNDDWGKALAQSDSFLDKKLGEVFSAEKLNEIKKQNERKNSY